MCRERPWSALNVDWNRVRVREGKECDLIRIALGSAGFQASGPQDARAAQAGLELAAGAWRVVAGGSGACSAPLGTVDPDYPGGVAREPPEFDAAGETPAAEVTQRVPARLDLVHLASRNGRREPGSGTGQAAAQAERTTGAQDAGSSSRAFKARSAREIIDQEPNPSIMSAKTRSALHSAAMYRKTVIREPHPGDGPAPGEVSLAP